MTKFERGMAVLRASWAVVKARPGLAALSGGGALLSVAIVGGLAAVLMPAVGFEQLQGKLLFALCLQVGVIPTTFTNFAIAAIADRHFRGDHLTVGDALALAVKRAPTILAWSAVSALVGFLIQAILERFKLGGVIASRLLGLAWALGTMFVIPILVIEDVTVRDAVSRSAKTFKQQWGPSVATELGLGLAMLVVFLVGGLAVFLVALVNPIVAIALGAMAIVGLLGAFGATSAVKNMALYRFAADGVVVGEFTVEQLNSAFKPKQKRFGRFFR